ncbi:MAG: hypothetical protein WC679_01025 [Bacteroidales bacterium]|jgi:hypothetical protein
MPSATTSDDLYKAQMHQLLHSRTQTISPVPGETLYVALFTTTPGLSGTGGTEVSQTNTNYARVAISTADTPNHKWTLTPTSPTFEFSNIEDITFNVPSSPGSNWGTITGAALYDSPTVGSGTLYYVAALTTPKTVNAGDGAPKILAGQLRIVRASC